MVDTIFEILYVIGCVAVFYLIIFYFSNWKQKKREALWKKNIEESQRHREGLKVSKRDEINTHRQLKSLGVKTDPKMTQFSNSKMTPK